MSSTCRNSRRGEPVPQLVTVGAPVGDGLVVAADQGGQHVRAGRARSCRRGRRGWSASPRSTAGRTGGGPPGRCRMPAILAIA